MTEQIRKTLITCTTIIALAFIYAWWTKGRYELAKTDGFPLIRLDKNTGKHITPFLAIILTGNL